ncbi:MAG: Hsp20/alpha crystallin family protein [Gemmatimonadetes bacterium]|nr:Hsp20/alpha crystallin family protein [Gemmatimonadota bacterium]
MSTQLPARWTTRRARPFATLPFDGFQHRLGRFFDEPFGFADAESFTWTPTVDVEENEKELTLTAEMPGMDEADVDIEIEDDVLTLSGEKKEERESEGSNGENLRIWERRYGSFSRSFALPKSVAADKIKAEFANGILTVRMPKTAQAKGRRIPIKGSRAKK